MAIAALQDEGYTVTSVELVTVGGKTEYKLTATKGAVSGYVFTTKTTVYYLVSFKTADTTAQEKLNIQSAYLYAGEEFTVTVKKDSAWSKTTYSMTSDSNACFHPRHCQRQYLDHQGYAQEQRQLRSEARLVLIVPWLYSF